MSVPSSVSGVSISSLHSVSYDRIERATNDVHSNGRSREERSRQAILSYEQIENAHSPVSSLSPPQSSASSTDARSGLDYLHESEKSSCTRLTSDSYLHPYAHSEGLQHGKAELHSAMPDPCHVGVQDMGVFLTTRIIGGQPSSFALSDKIRLQELENALMAPDVDDACIQASADETSASWEELLHDSMSDNVPIMYNGSQIVYDRGQQCWIPFASNQSSELQAVLNEGCQPKSLLVLCASAIAEGNLQRAEAVMQELQKVVSVYGNPMERLAAYMSEGLVAKLHASGSAIYRSLKCFQAPAADVLSAMQKLYEICPYFKFAYMSANGAIAEAFRGESKVHIFDFQIVQGTQWLSLIEALAKRPGGPPSVWITTVDDPSSHSYPIGGMRFVKQRLSKLAAFHGVPFEFHTVASKLSELQADMIERRPGESLAINFMLQLHHMPDESVCLTNPRDRILRLMKSLQPNVLTLVEQEASTNTTPFLPRFLEALDYYTAVFDSIDCKLPRNSKDRVNVEEQCLARDIVNVVACEDWERVERHELFAKWSVRMAMAGFRPRPLSSHVNNTIKDLLGAYSKNYRLKEQGEGLLLGWLNRYLVAASAWKIE